MERQAMRIPALRLAAFAVLLCSPASLKGQSAFWLYNNTAGVRAPVFDADGHPLEGSRYLVELWGGVTPDSLTPAIATWTSERVIIPFETGGFFVDRNPGARGYSTVFSVPPTQSAWLQVRAWEAALGATYEEAVSRGLGGYGESPLFSAQGSDAYDMLSLPGRLVGLESFSLRPVPEPSTWGLLLVGGLTIAFVMRRRRP
jgi:PEP-CTERM motif